jgi:hypothetical protein
MQFVSHDYVLVGKTSHGPPGEPPPRLAEPESAGHQGIESKS